MPDIHDLLNSFIDKQSPAPARFLFRMWGDQQKAITYRELREAIIGGALSTDYFLQWQQDYTKFLTDSYGPMVEQAVQQAKADMIASYGGQLEMPVHDMIDDYIKRHGGKLIQEVTEGQYQAINTLVRQATMTDTLTVDELARCIRPCIGLTERQSASLKSYYEQLREDGYSKKQALKKQQVKAAKMHRERAALIAETESAFAYNNGMDMLVDHNVQAGLVSPDVEDEWATAEDERVCPICGALDGVRVHHGDSFPNGYTCPPGHPACRCTKKYHYKAPERLPVETYKEFQSGEEANAYFGEKPDRALRRIDMDEYDRQKEGYRRSMYGEWDGELTPEQYSAVAYYTGDGYSGINGYLRGEMTSNMVKRWETLDGRSYKETISNITDALSKFELREPITVYRTCETDVLSRLKKEIGGTFIDEGFSSTSVLKKPVASGNVHMEIRVPAGTGRGAYINPLSGAQDEEYEFLLQRGTIFRIDGFVESDTETRITMTVIGCEPQPYNFATKEHVRQLWKERGLYEESSEEYL